MVEIGVGLKDAMRADVPLRRIAGLSDRSFVSFDGKRNEVRVRSEWESRAVVRFIHPVEPWLEEDRSSPAKLSLGDRPFTVVGPVPIASVL